MVTSYDHNYYSAARFTHYRLRIISWRLFDFRFSHHNYRGIFILRENLGELKCCWVSLVAPRLPRRETDYRMKNLVGHKTGLPNVRRKMKLFECHRAFTNKGLVFEYQFTQDLRLKFWQMINVEASTVPCQAHMYLKEVLRKFTIIESQNALTLHALK